MKKLFFTILCFLPNFALAQQPSAQEIIDRTDRNVSSVNRVMESQMTIKGERGSRSVSSRSWVEGNNKSFTEYLTPPREQGTKMLKLEKQLWIYSPSADRIIQISGHMLRQSVMGSDLSYEDMMEDRKLNDIYDSKVTGIETVGNRKCYVLQLTAKVEDVAYYSRRTWIDAERFVPLREELYAKSGQMLKRTEFSEVTKIGDRWYPMVVLYKDMLKQGNGTEFRITSIKFNENIPDYIFSKASLRK
jgi:outer membrane lipoprotein-sorting protein